MITRVTKAELDSRGKISGTRIEYRIFGVLVMVKRFINPTLDQIEDELHPMGERSFYTKF